MVRWMTKAAAILAAVVLAGAGTLSAQNFPERPVFIVLGPGPDAMPRLYGHKLTEIWGQQVLVEPQPAGGGMVATRSVARAEPDGHTMLLTTGSYTINEVLRPSFPFSLVRDFAPVAQIGSLSFMLLVHPSVPANSLADLLKLAREKPGALNCASSGVGTTAHLGCEMLRHYGKVDIVHVPYKGVAPALQDLLAGRVQMTFSVPTAVTHVKSGALKALAVTGAKRLATLPDVPTVREAGLADLEFSSWNGLHARVGTPAAIIAKINTDVAKVRAMPDIQQRMQDLGFTPEGGSPEDFGAFVKADIARWQRIVKDTGVKVE
ncbi:MAG TPA: tripartite tricarboxylate transporter substrate binding protein [Xanthobacteraceae bacterium]|nr:tripartite tricarboxylate transporter substrate binding protein [Xanthobacteraceae bacterium]